MRSLSLALLIPVLALLSWFAPAQLVSDDKAEAEMPRAGRLKPEAAGLCLEVVNPGPACEGVAKQIHVRVRNSSFSPIRGLMLSASFSPELQHESKANPVELPLPLLGPSETKEVPLNLTPTKTGEYQVKLYATASQQEDKTVEVKLKVAPKPSSANAFSAPASIAAPLNTAAPSPAYSDNLWNARSHVFTFVHAKAEGRSVQVSDLRVEYVQRTHEYKTADGTSKPGSYFEPVTKETLRSIPASKIRALRADAKRLSSNELLKVLKDPTTVVILREGETLDPFVLSMFKPETLFLILPQRTQASESDANPQTEFSRPYPPANTSGARFTPSSSD